MRVSSFLLPLLVLTLSLSSLQAPLLKIYTDYYRSYFNGIQVLDQCMKRPKTAAFIAGLNDSFMSSDPSNRTLRDLLIAVR